MLKTFQKPTASSAVAIVRGVPARSVSEALPSVEAQIRNTAQAVAHRLVSLSRNHIRMRNPEEKYSHAHVRNGVAQQEVRST